MPVLQMELINNFTCKIYVDNDEIYSGDLSEIPEKYRNRIIHDICEWADSLGKRGVNELLYSHLAWYEKRAPFCDDCDSYEDLDSNNCSNCSSELQEKYIHDRNEKIDKILTCIGMISKIEVGQ